jgi:hypothetical protein
MMLRAWSPSGWLKKYCRAQRQPKTTILLQHRPPPDDSAEPFDPGGDSHLLATIQGILSGPHGRLHYWDSCRGVETLECLTSALLWFLKSGYSSQGRRVSQSFVGGFPINIGKESFDVLASTGGGIV